MEKDSAIRAAYMLGDDELSKAHRSAVRMIAICDQQLERVKNKQHIKWLNENRDWYKRYNAQIILRMLQGE